MPVVKAACEISTVVDLLALSKAGEVKAARKISTVVDTIHRGFVPGQSGL